MVDMLALIQLWFDLIDKRNYLIKIYYQMLIANCCESTDLFINYLKLNLKFYIMDLRYESSIIIFSCTSPLYQFRILNIYLVNLLGCLFA